MHACSHFSPLIGLDLHTYLTIPSPLPTPNYGVVFDAFDYLPFFGTTVYANSIKRTSAGTQGIMLHIPTGGAWMPPLSVPTGPQRGEELFMGSKTVSVDGEPFSRFMLPVLSCNIAGMVPPFRPRRKESPKPSSPTLPTTLSLALPNNITVGGPPTINLQALLIKAGINALKKGKNAFKKTPKKSNLAQHTPQKRNGLPQNRKENTLDICTKHGEPVDIRDGSVYVEEQDFLLPGRLPLVWLRTYSSGRIDEEGLCGYGWSTPADTRLEIQHHENVAILRQPEGMTLFPALPRADGYDQGICSLLDSSRLWRESRTGEVTWWVEQEDNTRLQFRGNQQTLAIAQLADRNGNGWQFDWQGQALNCIREFTLTGMSGREIPVIWQNGRLLALQLRDGQSGDITPLTRYEYNSDNQLQAEIDAFAHCRRFFYQQRHMTCHVNRNGQRFHYQYDEKWRVVHTWGDGEVWAYRFTWHDLLNEVDITDFAGRVTTVSFDEDGLPIAEINPEGGYTLFFYDEAGRSVGVTTPDGSNYRQQYDAQGRIVAKYLPDGSAIRATYNDHGDLLTFTDEQGACWQSEYDSRGNLLSQTDPTGVISRYQYYADGQLRAADIPGAAQSQYQYDCYGFLQTLNQAGAGITQLRHSARGNLLERIDASGALTRFAWDAKDRLVAVKDPNGSEIRIAYDPQNAPVQITDEAGQVTRFRYTCTGMLSSCKTPDGATIGYHYDPEDRLLTVINQNGQCWQLTRDALGRVVTETDYYGQITHYGWDKGNRLISREDPLGRQVRYSYDRAGYLSERTSGDGTLQARYRYDPCGRLVSCENPWRQLSWHYDEAGRLLTEEQDGFRLQYAYNDRGLLISRRSDSGHQVHYTLDDYDRLSQIQLNDDAPILLQYDKAGRRVSEQLSAEVTRHFAYDPLGQLTSQQVLQSDLPLFSSQYYRDRVGNLTGRDDSLWGIDRYTYDPVGRLTAHLTPDGNLRRFVQDAAGNHLQTQTRAVNDSAGGWFREGYHNGVRYVFDRAGELRQRRDMHNPGAKEDFVWDDNRQLVAVHKGEKSVHYGYDGLGRRVFKQTAEETCWFYWQGDALAGETVTSAGAPLTAQSLFDIASRLQRQKAQEALFAGMREYIYYPGSFQPLALLTQEAGKKASWHYHCDPNGAPVRLTSPAGEIVWSEKTGVWGEKGKVFASRITNPLRFQGQYFDEETGLHYNRYRYYSPDIAGFISQDPIGLRGGLNLYAYAPNPLSWIDPFGLTSCGKTSSYIDPKDVRYMQSSIKNKTGDYTVLGNAEALRNGALKASDLPPIRVWKDESGKIWTLDHRRLAAFKLAELDKVPFKWASPGEIKSQQWKMTTKTDGKSIILKLEDGTRKILE